ncbi:hypothetical protein [Vibrio vulnificus]|uniref:hypothetical protein n=1 Tax=Vibrio vulnificus TaxID=672 RepID=UPI0010291F40|nr:hypothetical protein [Vibrio vulnificus]ELA8134747.1 hypothetical protein [Vibrio parahaemolyticus]MCU8266437.1 hypothetical protein [Vibrio vulnificus]RZP92339.1 hypothetical protein D8T62_04745 [Vibrio vulnificus]HAS8188091.1 hypothetical protein [Vibrio vulnificus]HAS8512480.1 hypothetical protein [Vibrio vulnificus]
MASIVENINVDSDPRFLFDVSFVLDIVSNQDDIDLRIDIAKDAVRKGQVEDLKQKRNRFAESNVALSEYEWIDNSDYVTRYFLWYLLRLTLQDESVGRFSFHSGSDLSFEFDTAFGRKSIDKSKSSIPSFVEKGPMVRIHTIIFLHYLLSEKNLKDVGQKGAMEAIKKLILGFKRSHFYKLTEEENQSRAAWTRNKLENDGVVLPLEIPLNEKCRNLSLAISLYLWGKSYPFPSSMFGIGSHVSKSEYVHKLNLSWNQYKHREKNKIKKVKAYSFEMEESLQKKIDHLSKALDMKKNRLIEYLIEQEYTKQTKK